MTDGLLLDDRIRGVPPGTAAFPASAVAARGWHPASGSMSLPVLTMDETAFADNRDLMLGYVRAVGAEIAPHAKTPMAPDLARSLVEAGAWGTTVADTRQAAVMLRAGLGRLILANEVGGHGGADRLAALVGAWPKAELYLFSDSVAAVDALADAWRKHDSLPPLRILVETGIGRGGARTLEAGRQVAEAVLAADGRLSLAGVATYEGAATQPTPEQTDEAIARCLTLVAEMHACVRKRVGPGLPLIVTAGGSVYFDRVVAALSPVVAADEASTLVLRSGAIFFHDHGVYERALAALDARKGFAVADVAPSAAEGFRPALRVWAEVLSRPEPELAICGMGMRDVSFDQDLPVTLRAFRGGQLLTPTPAAKVVKLNDQHAFLALPADDDIRVGDVIEFGISHPCTCLDRYRVVFGVDDNGRVVRAIPTYFG